RRFTTDEPPEVVFAAVEQSLRLHVGGSIERHGNAFRVRNGTMNLNFAFVAEVNAEIALGQPAPGFVDVQGTVTLSPNTFFWIMAITGLFCLWFLWGFNVLYFVMDPRPNYQAALDRVQLSPQAPYGG
ncbi:MAG TPA: hypothetical protein VFP80_06230, partial [Thermoanaerobaculia bacterium]|nr:hypothetical protein [Thermoanaerobaculia bacterium]